MVKGTGEKAKKIKLPKKEFLEGMEAFAPIAEAGMTIAEFIAMIAV